MIRTILTSVFDGASLAALAYVAYLAVCALERAAGRRK
jgi:hypothetical protein